MYYEEVIEALNNSQIKYLIIGGLAVNLYGVHRLTRDLDLMIEVSEETIKEFAHIMKGLGYSTPAPPEKWMKITALSFFHESEEYKQVDLFIKNPIDFEEAYKRRKTFKINDIPFPCISEEDLITMKEKSGRDRDLIDTGSLKMLKKTKSHEKT